MGGETDDPSKRGVRSSEALPPVAIALHTTGAVATWEGALVTTEDAVVTFFFQRLALTR